MRRNLTVLVVLALSLLASACGDDGSSVRNIGGSGSGSASGSVSGSAGGSGSASGSAVAGCPEASGSASETAGEIHVTLDEWRIAIEEDEVPSGDVKIEATNAGEEPHEVVVVRADSIEDIPVDEDGAADEEALEPGALLGEIEAFPAGEECEGVFDLEPGNYVFLCNVVEHHDASEAHFAEGMATEVTVSD